MKKEILYLRLPNNAEYRETIVTDDGQIGIIYERKSQENHLKKPEKLIGGSEVYQKENSPYWYCKIKDGDEFMFLDFRDLCTLDLLAEKNKSRKFITEREIDFRNKVIGALSNKPEGGFRWIPSCEICVDDAGNLFFSQNLEKHVNLSYESWQEKLVAYSPENGSGMADVNLYYLLLLRWLKDGMINLSQITWDSTSLIKENDNSVIKELLPSKEIGGIKGFIGNTYKYVKNSNTDSGVSLVSYYYEDSFVEYPLSTNLIVHSYQKEIKNTVGLLELKK